MAAAKKKHDCPLLKFFQGDCTCSAPEPEQKPEQKEDDPAPVQPQPPVEAAGQGKSQEDSGGTAQVEKAEEKKENAPQTDVPAQPEPPVEATDQEKSDDTPQVEESETEKQEKEENSPQEDEAVINAALQECQKDTPAFMDRLPAKFDPEGKRLDQGTGLFTEEAIREKEFIPARDDKRQELTELDAITAGRAAFAENDQADGFVDTFRHAGLKSMENNGLMGARLPEQPWSDDYWAIYLGMLGKRYADPGFPGEWDWKVNYDYIQRNPAQQIVANGDSNAINRLSPSEKYDILVGDANMSLTKKMWEEGKGYYSRNGTVETWMGLCHGWAPAAYMLPRPKRSVTVPAADGKTSITFYPADIKALATLLWAKVRTTTEFIGGRCNDKNPARDPQTGRIISQNCFDTNPGSWHLAVVNQIGASQRSMVLDATYDYEVWNQPLVAYNYRYFNPQRMVYARSLPEASVLKSSFGNDWFIRYRSGETETIVGIAMDVSYMVETSPAQYSTDSAARDRVQTVRYYYDLELDFTGNIIGGEWYQNAHPDFLWTPVKGARALTYWEARYGLSGTWEGNQPMNEDWRRVAATISGYQKAPLAAIVERLIELANV